MSKSAMLAAVAAAAGLSEGAEFVLDAAFIKANFPDVAASLAAEGKAESVKAGADAERARILGIEAAALPGHDDIIKAHKADGSKTPADAAMAIIAAENTARGKQLAALESDDKQVQVRSQPANPATAAAPAAASTDALKGEDKYRAEWAADASLATEFRGFEAYASFRTMEDSGRVKIYKGRAA